MTKEEINLIALEAFPIDMLETSKGCFDDMNLGDRQLFIAGFKKAASMMYNDDDMAKSHLAGAIFAYGRKSAKRDERESHFKEYLQSVKKSK